MTPYDYRRLEAIERRQTIAEERDRVADERLGRMEQKLDQLLTAAAMGKGAFWIVTRIGGFMVVVLGALGWTADHFHWWQK